ncbi:hypothetical protein ACU60T_25345 [Klebsiella aerogenes]
MTVTSHYGSQSSITGHYLDALGNPISYVPGEFEVVDGPINAVIFVDSKTDSKGMSLAFIPANQGCIAVKVTPGDEMKFFQRVFNI